MKKYIKISIICAVVITLITTIPFPFRVDFSREGFRLYEDMSSEEKITITIKGWHWRSLTGFNRMNGSVEIIDSSGECLTYNFLPLYRVLGANELKDISLGSLSRYNPIKNQVDFAEIYDYRGNTFIISPVNSVGSMYYDTASVDGEKNGRDIIDLIEPYISLHFD